MRYFYWKIAKIALRWRLCPQNPYLRRLGAKRLGPCPGLRPRQRRGAGKRKKKFLRRKPGALSL